MKSSLTRPLRSRRSRRARLQRQRAYNRRFWRPGLEGLEPRLMLARDLLIADHVTDSILRFDGETGAPLGAFVPSGSGGLVDPHDPTFGPSGDLFVVSNAPGAPKILRFDGDTGASLGTFVNTGSGGFAGATALAFGPNGDLYAATGGSSVLRYDGDTGTFLGVAASGNGIKRACGAEFGPDGNLYVLDADSFNNTAYDRILRFNPDTGQFLDVFVQSGSLEDPCLFGFGPDGHVYVPDFKLQDVRSFNGTTGELQQVFPRNSFLIESFAFDVVLGPDGNAYVPTAERILRYEGETGQFLNVFVEGTGGAIAFFPTPGAPSDLAATALTAPPSAFVGEDISIDFTVTNNSTEAAPVDEWVDVLYFSADDVFDPFDQEIGRIPHTGGLAGGVSYSETLTVATPTVQAGDYHVFVFSDRRGQVPDTNRLNNVQITAGTTTVLPRTENVDPARTVAVGRTLSAWTTADLVGNQLTIDYTVYNLTGGFVDNVSLETTLQAGVSFNSASLPPNIAGQTLSWDFGLLGPLATATVQVTVLLDNPIPLQLDNGASSTGVVNFTEAVADAAHPAMLRTDPIQSGLLAPTADANSNDLFVRAKAAELNQDVNMILAFMTEEISYESYAGSLRGARGALWSNAGNALDQASLMIGLLRASGVPAQYAQGTLPDVLAQELILSMFSEPLRVTGFIPDGATLSDPANDPELLTETRDHFWVQFDTGTGLQDADPSFSTATLGQTFAPVGTTFDEVPDAMRHKVRLQVDRELANTASALFGFGSPLGRATVLNETFNAAELSGKPLSIGHFVDRQAIGTPIFTSITNVYSPYIAVGDYAFPISQDDLRRGTDYQELITSFPFGTQVLTGLFLTVETSGPGTAGEVLERTLLDLIGFDVRTHGGTPNLNFDPAGPPTLTDTDIFTVNVATGPMLPGVQYSLTQEIAGLQTRLRASQSNPSLTPDSADALRQVVIGASRLNAVNYFVVSDVETDRLAEFLQVRAYTAQPRIIISAAKLGADADTGEAVLQMSLDLRSNHLRVVARPSQNVAVQPVFQFTRGVRENIIETGIIERQAARVGITTPIASTSNIFAAAAEQHIPLLFLGLDNLSELDGLNVSAEAKARLTQTVNDGFAVLMPAQPVDFGGRLTTAWYQIDLVTGESIGVTENGLHFAIAEWGANMTIIGVEIGILQSILVVFLNVLYNPECQAGADLKKCREIINNSNNGLTVISAGQTAAGIAGGGAALGPGLAFVIGWALGNLLSDLALGSLGKDPPAPDYWISPEVPLDALQNLSGTGVVVDVALDPIFSLPRDGNFLPTVYRVGIKNEGTTDDRFMLSVLEAPTGFEVITSVNEITVPAGATAEVGLALRPTSALPPPGAVDTFTVMVSSATDGSIQDTVIKDFVVPEIHGVRFILDPPEVATIPGQSVDVALVIESSGNVNEFVDFELSSTPGLAVTGLVDTAVGAGQLEVLILTVTPDPGVPLNTILHAEITADYDGPEQAIFVLPVTVAAPGAAAAVSAGRFIRDFFGNADLADQFDDLSVALTNLAQQPSSEVFHSQAVASLDSVLTLLAVDPIFTNFGDRFQAPRDALAAAGTPAEVLAALNELGAALDGFGDAVFFANEFNFELFLNPNSQVAQPEVPIQYELRIHHIGGVSAGTYNIGLSGLPPTVVADLSDTQVTLNRDEFASVFVTLTQDSAEELLAFSFSVDVSVEGFPEIAKSVVGSLAARDEIVSIVSVEATPPFADAGGVVEVSARVLNAVNRQQSAKASFVVKDGSGVEVRPPSAPVDVALTVQASLVDVELGSVDTTGLADGYYSIEVTLTDATDQPIPGATGRGTLLVGSPLEASLEVGPQLLPPGTHILDSALEIEATTFPLTPPVLVGQRAVAGAGDAIRNGDFVYVAGSAGITVLNIAGANVSNPQLVRTVGSATSMLRIRGNLLVATLSRPGGASTRIDTFSLADPSNPVLLGTTGDIPYGSATDVVLTDTHAFVVIVNLIFAAGPDVRTQNGGVFAVNISNPAAPFFDGDAITPPVANSARRDGVDDGVLFNVNGSNNDGVGVVLGFDLSGGNQMTWSAALASPTILYVVGSSATGTDTQTGVGLVRVVDVSDPRNMQLLRDVSIPGTVHILDIAVQGDRALVTGTEGGLADFTPGTPFTGNVVQATLDLTDPANPQIIDNEELTLAARGLDRSASLGGGLFAFSSLGPVGDTPGLFVANSRDPGAFVKTTVPAAIGSVTAGGDLIFTTDGSSLIIYRIPTTTPLTLVGFEPIAGGYRGVAARNNVAYACSDSGIKVLDYSDPANPVLQGTVGSGVNIGCRLQDDLLLVQRLVAGGLWVLDVYSIQSNPLSPVLLGSTSAINYVNPNNTSGLESTSTHAFVTRYTFCSFLGSNDIYVHMGELFSIALNLNDPDNPTSAAPALVNVLFNTFGDTSPNSVVGDVSGCAQGGGDHNVFGVAMANPQTAYLAASSVVGGNTNPPGGIGRVHIVDVTNPASPSLVRNLDIPGTVQAVGIGISGNTAVVIGSTDGWVDNPSTGLRNGNLTVTTLDLSDPHNPEIVAHRVLDRRARAFWTNTGSLGGSLFGFSSIDFVNPNTNADLLLIDVSNPRNPSVISTGIPLDTVPPNSISFDGQYVFTLGSTGGAVGLSIYELNEIPIPVTASVQIPNGTGVEVVSGSFSTPPDQVIVGVDFDTLVWNTTLSSLRPSFRVTWDTEVASLQPGEARRVTLDTTIDFGFQGSPGQISLPAERVVAEQVLSLEPDTRTVRPGEQAAYVLTMENPTLAEVTYDLAVLGVAAEWVEIASQVSVPAGGSVEVPIVLTSDPFAVLSEYGFVVQATVGGVSSSVQGTLVLVGEPLLPEVQPEAYGVVVEVLPPGQATAGQGMPGVFTVRVTNTGSVLDTYALSVTGLPVGFAAAFLQGGVAVTSIEVPPGASNFRELTLSLVPPICTTAGDYPFVVLATSLTLPTAADEAEGIVTVSDIGVAVELTPDSGPPGVFQMTVINTGHIAETFDLTLAGPAALAATLELASVTLGVGESQVVEIEVDAIDFAFPGSLSLVGVATSRSEPVVRDADEAAVSIAGTLGLDAEFDPAAVTLPLPGPADGLLLVDNIGNLEDAYEAEIVGTTGPLTAQLIGLDGLPASSVPLFRLPGLASGALLLRTNLTSTGEGTVTVRVTSLTNPDLSVERTFVVNSEEVVNEPPTADAGGPYTVVAGNAVTLSGSGTDPDGDPQLLTFAWDLDGDGQFGETGTDAARGDETGRTPSFHAAGLAPGDYTVTLRVTDERGDAAEDTAAITVEQPLLRIERIVVNGGAAQRSNVETIEIFVSADFDIQPLIDSGAVVQAIKLYRVTGATGELPLTASRFQWDAAQKRLLLDTTLDGLGGSRRTMLSDARYQLRLADAVFEDTDGVADALYRFGFHRLEADFDGDRDVDVAPLRRPQRPAPVRLRLRPGRRQRHRPRRLQHLETPLSQHGLSGGKKGRR